MNTHFVSVLIEEYDVVVECESHCFVEFHNPCKPVDKEALERIEVVKVAYDYLFSIFGEREQMMRGKLLDIMFQLKLALVFGRLLEIFVNFIYHLARNHKT